VTPKAIPRWQPPRQKTAPTKERAHYISADWRAIRARILVRDSFTCSVCRLIVMGKDAHVDHIIPLEEGGTDEDSNLQTLCAKHHGVKTRGEQRRRGLL